MINAQLEPVKVDTLVVGAGPAGSACALSLLKAGKDCLLIDKATYPRVKLCGGLFTGKSQQTLRRLLGEVAYEECMNQAVVSRQKDLVLWRGKDLLVRCPLKREVVLVDRPVLDNWLVQYYRQQGGQIIEGDGLSTLDLGQHQATLQSGRQITYCHLVAADGANSRVAWLMQQQDPKFRPSHKSVCCLEVNVDREDLPDAQDVNIYFDIMPKTYAWSFAKGDKVCLGTGLLPGVTEDIRQQMTRFIQMLGVRHPEKYPLRGALIPYDQPLDVWGNVIFVGDAARFIEPLTWEGIYYALESGVRAAESLATGTSYRLLTRHLRTTMRRAGFFQWLIFEWKPFVRLVYKKAPGGSRFIGHYYDTNIEQLPEQSFLKLLGIVALKGLKHTLLRK